MHDTITPTPSTVPIAVNGLGIGTYHDWCNRGPQTGVSHGETLVVADVDSVSFSLTILDEYRQYQAGIVIDDDERLKLARALIGSEAVIVGREDVQFVLDYDRVNQHSSEQMRRMSEVFSRFSAVLTPEHAP